MKTAVNSEKISVQNKLNCLYPEGALDASKMKEARDYVYNVMREGSAKEKAQVKEFLTKLVERAGDHAAGDTVSGESPHADYGMRARFYFYIMRREGTKEESEIAVNYFEKVVKDEILRQEPNLGRIERSADMLLFLEAMDAAKTLREVGERLGEQALGRTTAGVNVPNAGFSRAARHVTNIAKILEAAPEFVEKPAKDAFKGFGPGHNSW